jgi:hypothetical protein
MPRRRKSAPVEIPWEIMTMSPPWRPFTVSAKIPRITKPMWATEV